MAGVSDNASRAAAKGRLGLGLLVLAWGVQAIITQSVLVREAIVLMSGSEFAWGVVLFAWLLGVAVGASLGGRLAKRPRPDVVLAFTLLGLGAVTAADLWVFRGARAWLGVSPGEMLPLPTTAAASLLFIPPASVFIGMAFPLACAVGPPGGRVLSFARVYALESAGSLVGGAAFSFWLVDHSSPIQTILVCTALTTAASTWLLWRRASDEARAPSGRRRAGCVACLAVLVLASLLLALAAGSRLDRQLIARRWATIAPGYGLVAESESRYQNLALGLREQQYSLYCNGQIAADFPDPYTFVPLAHLWMCEHPEPRRILVLGGGAEGLLSEILRHPVEHVDYVEPDAMQIELILPFLAEDDRRALSDVRVTVHHEDARHFVKTQRDRFDLVIARLPEPTSAFRARFYTSEFFGELRRAMTAQSVLCMTAAAAPGELSPLSAEYLASLRATMHRHFPFITVCWGEPAHVFAATQDGLTATEAAELTRRYKERGVTGSRFDPLWFEATDRLTAEKVRRRANELDRTSEPAISTDLRPAIYVQRLALWERMTSDRSRGFIERLRCVDLQELVAALAVLAGATLLSCRSWRLAPRQNHGSARGGESCSTGSVLHVGDPGQERNPIRGLGAVVLSVATTGFVTMAMSLIWLFAFQNLYGYVYQRIGWIVALFMAGLAIGCLLSERWAIRGTRGNWRDETALRRRLIALDVAIALLATAIPRVLAGLDRLQAASNAFSLVEYTISLLVCLTGVVCGTAFPLAAAWLSAKRRAAFQGDDGRTVGVVVGADHAGACVGALLTGILLVPVFGTTVAAYVLAGTKLASAVILSASAERNPTISEP